MRQQQAPGITPLPPATHHTLTRPPQLDRASLAARLSPGACARCAHCSLRHIVLRAHVFEQIHVSSSLIRGCRFVTTHPYSTTSIATAGSTRHPGLVPRIRDEAGALSPCRPVSVPLGARSRQLLWSFHISLRCCQPGSYETQSLGRRLLRVPLYALDDFDEHQLVLGVEQPHE